jgi:hypothetical protein
VLLSRQSRMANCESLIYGAHQVSMAIPTSHRRFGWNVRKVTNALDQVAWLEP